MKKITALTGILSLVLVLTASATSSRLNYVDGKDRNVVTTEKMEQFTRNTLDALSSGHVGLQQGALRMIIQYGDKVDFRGAMFGVMRIYRDSDDIKMRQMAVVALSKIDNHMVREYLKRAVQFEKCECVRKTMQAVIAEKAA